MKDLRGSGLLHDRNEVGHENEDPRGCDRGGGNKLGCGSDMVISVLRTVVGVLIFHALEMEVHSVNSLLYSCI